MKAVRTDRELECPEIDAGLRARGGRSGGDCPLVRPAFAGTDNGRFVRLTVANRGLSQARNRGRNRHATVP
ncbi:MAG: hypothetical protein EOS17_18580 [Mesorhizobium sp.]|nr:MAG: hypothetical protein EOR97_11255 [Mesorhizobium sp.]RWO67832.1 MAG: hypothetical protein EOS17_18580 [Mesorhizobium sp.]